MLKIAKLAWSLRNINNTASRNPTNHLARLEGEVNRMQLTATESKMAAAIRILSGVGTVMQATE